LASLVRHIQGELQAQQQRQMSMSGQPGMSGYKSPSGPSSPKMGDVNPAMSEPPAIGNQQGAVVNPNTNQQ
jgi:hypothetical protein